jgi:hypothetical protein
VTRPDPRSEPKIICVDNNHQSVVVIALSLHMYIWHCGDRGPVFILRHCCHCHWQPTHPKDELDTKGDLLSLSPLVQHLSQDLITTLPPSYCVLHREKSLANRQ